MYTIDLKVRTVKIVLFVCTYVHVNTYYLVISEYVIVGFRLARIFFSESVGNSCRSA